MKRRPGYKPPTRVRILLYGFGPYRQFKNNVSERILRKIPKRPGLTKEGALVSDLLKLLLKIRAKESGVAARLIARSDELEALAAGVRKNLNILGGWRYEQFGKDALDLVEGRLAFAIENGKLKMSRIRTEEPVDA